MSPKWRIVAVVDSSPAGEPPPTDAVVRVTLNNRETQWVFGYVESVMGPKELSSDEALAQIAAISLHAVTWRDGMQEIRGVLKQWHPKL